MGLLVLDPGADALAADELLEDLDESCLCEHTAGDHAPDGCRAGDCLCAAAWEDLGAADLDDTLEVDVVRVTAFLKAARAHRRKLEQNRADAIAKDPTRSPRANKPRLTATKAVAPSRQKISRAVAPSRAVALSNYEDDGRTHFDEDVLETVLAG